MDTLQKLQILQNAMLNTRETGYTATLRRIMQTTDILVLAGKATDLPVLHKVDYENVLEAVTHSNVPLFIDNGKLQELLASAIKEITMLRQQLQNSVPLPPHGVAIVDSYKIAEEHSAIGY